MTTAFELWSTHIQGLKDTGAYEATHIMATILESTFNSDLAHQWSLAASDLNGPSTMEQILQFLKARLNTALPQAQLKKASSSQVFKQPPSMGATIRYCIEIRSELNQVAQQVSLVKQLKRMHRPLRPVHRQLRLVMSTSPPIILLSCPQSSHWQHVDFANRRLEHS